MKRVVIESPLGGNFARNIKYARLCALDCMRRGEAWYASHLLLTQVLNDATPEERKLGMEIGFEWGTQGELAVIYQDLGISGGMVEGIKRHQSHSIPIEYRNLPNDLMAQLDGIAADIHETDGITTKS